MKRFLLPPLLLGLASCATNASSAGSAAGDAGCGGLVDIENAYQSVADSVHAGTATNASVDSKLIVLADSVQRSIDLAGPRTKPVLDTILSDVQTTRSTVDGAGFAAAGTNADQIDADLTRLDRLCGGNPGPPPSDSQTPTPVDSPSPTFSPTPAMYALRVKTISKECFGSAGCDVEVRIELSIVDAAAVGEPAELTVAIVGDESGPEVETIDVGADGKYTPPDVVLSTPSNATKVTARITEATPTG